MRFDIISAQPELLLSPLNHSIMKRAQDRGLLSLGIHNLRDYGIGPHKQIDDYQYGGGAGMVIMPEPLDACISDLLSETSYDEVIFLTPDGEVYNQSIANSLSLRGNIMLICGHYKGIDQRIRDKYVTLELSIGDYVLSGGEIAACVLVDSITRLIPGVLNDASSALSDSHQDNLLAPPVYTRPSTFKGMKVPDILLSGHDALIEDWRLEQSEIKTQTIRPDLYNEG